MPKSSRIVGRNKIIPGNKHKPRPVLMIPLAVIALIVVFAGAGFAFAANQEEDNAFCASCHSQPETAFFQRFQAATATDLASDHFLKKEVKCIHCHSGEGFGGRLSAMVMGARNAAYWFSGAAQQPAPLNFPIADANCLKCHQTVTTQRDRSNHFHGFLSRWQAVDPNAATCVSCHGGHNTDGTPSLAMVNETRAQQVCNACHSVLAN